MSEHSNLDPPFELSRVLALSGLMTLLFLSRMIYSPLLISLETTYGLTHRQGGALFLAISVGSSISTLTSGFVARRLLHRGAVALAMAIAGVAMVVLGTEPPVVLFYAGTVLLGVGVGLYIPSAVSILTASEHHWGKGLAIHEFGPVLGFSLAPLVAQLTLRYATWHVPFIVLGMTGILSAILFARTSTGGAFPGAPPSLRNIAAIMRVGPFWVLLLFFVAVVALEVGVYSMLPTFLVEEHQFSAGQANTLVSISRLLALFLLLISGWLTDLLGAKRLILLVCGAAGIATVGIGLFSGTALRIAVLLQPMLVASFFPPGFVELARVTPPESRNVSVSLVTPLAGLIGGGLVPTLLGHLAELGVFASGFLGLGAIMLGSLAFLPILPGRAPRVLRRDR
jgi:NNP family nitrate/nitrite transporter-like MFS transporter